MVPLLAMAGSGVAVFAAGGATMESGIAPAQPASKATSIAAAEQATAEETTRMPMLASSSMGNFMIG